MKNASDSIAMRMIFSDLLYQEMVHNKNIWLIVGDLGYYVFDKIFVNFPDRSINTGASEQAALDVCIGLASSGSLPVFYSITPFALYRPYESWRTYINHEKIPVIVAGSGRDFDYEHDGMSHYAHDVEQHLQLLPNVISYFPEDNQKLISEWEYERDAHEFKRPLFFSLKR